MSSLCLCYACTVDTIQWGLSIEFGVYEIIKKNNKNKIVCLLIEMYLLGNLQAFKEGA